MTTVVSREPSQPPCVVGKVSEPIQGNRVSKAQPPAQSTVPALLPLDHTVGGRAKLSNAALTQLSELLSSSALETRLRDQVAKSRPNPLSNTPHS